MMERFIKKVIPIKLLYFLVRVYLFIDRRERFAASAVIFYQDKVLLVRHRYGDSSWTMPGGFIYSEESPEEGLRREIREEVGLGLSLIELLSTDRDERPQHNVTVHRFYAQAKSEECIIDELEIKEARWFEIEEIQSLQVASDPHLKRAIKHHTYVTG